MKKSSKVEIDRRVNVVLELIIDGYPNSKIVQYGSARWDITTRQVYDYIEKARELILESTKEKTEVEISKAQRRYENIYKKSFSDNLLAISLNAEKARCELLGLNKPSKTALTDPTGENEYSGITTDERRVEQVVEICNRIRERRDSGASD